MSGPAATTPRSLLVVAGLAAAAVLLGVVLVQHHQGPADLGSQENATVKRVVDGDTLVVQIGGSEERVRLIGIDTPESVAGNQPVECYGPEASQRLSQLLPAGTAVRLARDIEPRDRYDRLLAYVYRVDDSLLVNRDQIARGYAETMEYPPNTALAAELAAAQDLARTAGAGMWSACS
jgi:micrococcal nuclease